ncbi:MAG: STELLO glycosyltransferase family protein, partial [Gammaproteobacteria bacterium]|nr:STELLO glycosyltransferase family protein [Gammaproteobacteria bacterium]
GFIFDTDDDNAPLDNWQKRELRTQARACTHAGWINVYRCFTDEHIWPRGLPLEYILNNDSIELQKNTVAVNSPIQQGLANGSPDVDAVWRLTLDKNIAFEANSSILLKEGAWCPFNSQSTWWFPQAFPLLYLPSYVSFRMTDIWRSFVAQRCLWAMKHGLVFHGPEMFQERNPHNLIRDFEQEIPGYVGNTKICKILEKQNLTSGLEQVGDNLHRCYESLVSAGFIPPQEMKLVEAWLLDLSITMNAKSN